MRRVLPFAVVWLAAWSPFAAAQPTADAFLPSKSEVGSLPIGCSGYCPVTLKLEQRWVQGRAEAWSDFGGRRYLLADRRNQAIFLAAPRDYAPLLDGDCPVTYRDVRRRSPGELRYGAVHQGRLVFFAGAAHLRKFKELPEIYYKSAIAAELQPVGARTQNPGGGMVEADGAPVAMSGYCPVTLRNEGRWARGRDEFTSAMDGIQFRFAGADQQTEFLDRPERFFSSSGGYCPVTLQRTGRRVEGRAEFVVEYDTRLYLFATEADKQEFISNPKAYGDVAVAADRGPINRSGAGTTGPEAAESSGVPLR
ncbi:hypothetical protein OAS39_05685 [Pirellulales bacterium]|nr:hypothetical protein [Pirellulales bacterium]